MAVDVLNYQAGIYRVVPLSSIGIHLVGLPAAGAFNNVPAAAAAPSVNDVVVAINFVSLIVRIFAEKSCVVAPACACSVVSPASVKSVQLVPVKFAESLSLA